MWVVKDEDGEYLTDPGVCVCMGESLSEAYRFDSKEAALDAGADVFRFAKVVKVVSKASKKMREALESIATCGTNCRICRELAKRAL